MVEPSPAQSLVPKAAAGDRAAFDALCKLFHSRLEAFLRSRIKSHLRRRLEIDDLVQETMAQAFQSIGRFHGHDEDSFFGWMTGIAKHVVLRAVEKVGRIQPLRIDLELVGSDPSPSKALARNERFDRLRRSIDSLSGEHREVIRLVRIEGHSLETAAEKLKRSPEAVRKLLWRALKELRRSFGNTESLHLPPRSMDRKDESDGD